MYSLVRIQVAGERRKNSNLYLYVNGGTCVLLRLAAGFRLCGNNPLLRG